MLMMQHKSCNHWGSPLDCGGYNSVFAAAVGLCCMHSAILCCFPKNKIISAAVCLIAANIYATVGYPNDTVH